MNQKEWEALDRAVNQALDLEEEAQESFLRKRFEGDPGILSKAMRLLAGARGEPCEFLQKPLLAYLADAVKNGNTRLEKDLSALEHYRILEPLGEGGMGRVYLAEQLQPVRRQVALKVIKTGLDDEELLSRFRLEYQSLAQMAHEHVARIHEVDITPLGRPFFTMEYFSGVPINRFVKECQASLKQRIDLFLQVCEGVAHAHQKGIIHRDLKPSNILVAMVDGRPLAKIIDFGIAKIMVGDAFAGEIPQTRLGGIMGTPAYMSPEQFERKDLDTRVDVYGLGVVLYELLSGLPPFDPARLRELPPAEVMRVIGEETPPLPSARIKGAKRPPGKSATGEPTLSSGVKGDLDWIAMKALEKDRERRYPTVEALASDMRHYLANRPVSALPPHAFYLLGKFVRRHLAGVTAALVVFAALILATLFSLVARSETEVKAGQLQATLDFLREMLAAPRPRTAGRDVRVVDVLESVESRIERDFADQPLIRGMCYHTTGLTWSESGRYEKAECSLMEALEIRLELLGPTHPETLTTMERLAMNHTRFGNFYRAEALYNQILGNLPAKGRKTRSLKNQARRGLAETLRKQGRADEAAPLFREVLISQMREGRSGEANTFITMRGLAIALAANRETEEALAYFHMAYECQAGLFGEDSLDALATENGLINEMVNQGLLARAEARYREAYESRRRLLGESHTETQDSLHGLCNVLYQQGKLERAEAICRRVTELRARSLGPAHRDSLRSKNIYALILKEGNRLEEAREILQEILRDQRVAFGAADADALSTANNLADTWLRLGEPAEAERLARATLDIQEKRYDKTHRDSLTIRCTLGEALMARERYEEALRLFRFNHQTAQNQAGGDVNFAALYQGFYGACLGKTGRFEEGERQLRESLGRLEATGHFFQQIIRRHLKELRIDWASSEQKPREQP